MPASITTSSISRRALRAFGVALGLVLVVLAGATRAQAAPAQVPSSTTVPGQSTQGTPTTTQNLLSSTTTVPGATSTAAVTTTTAGASSNDAAADDNRRVWYVVGGLVVVALALACLTIWYWFRTRPTGVARSGASGRHGRGSAPVDHEPPDTSAAPAATEAVAASAITPARGTEAVTTVPADVRAAALGGRAARRAERRALTADEAPEHDSSDQDWAPRGTGEHDRVEVDRPGARRPGRSARAAALDRAREDD